MKTAEPEMMIFSTYHVFGSGSSGVTTFVRPDMTATEYLVAVEELKKLAVDDGHNGFGGTESVPRADAVRLGVLRYYWAHPGPDATNIVPGMVRVDWTALGVRRAVARGFGDCPVNDACEASEKERDAEAAEMAIRARFASGSP